MMNIRKMRILVIEDEISLLKIIARRLAEEGGYEEGKVAFLDPLTELLKTRFVEHPPYVFSSLAADGRKGGGFRYCGAILPVEKFPQAWKGGTEIATKHGIPFMCGVQVLGHCHSMNFCYVYTFNRADEKEIQTVRDAMKDSNKLALELGGMPWKAEAAAQTQIMQKMDLNTVDLIKRIRNMLDPNGIMNPGNWSDK